MTVRVERTFDVPASPERVWSFISDPAKRAGAISFVEGFEQTGDRTAVWNVKLPIPVVNKHVSVETEDLELEPPTYVKFAGRSKVLHVIGEHRLRAIDGGTSVTNTFTVDGKLPGVERFFERNMDDQLRNVERALRADLEVDAR